jgi:2-methylcitrate dehydratase PrpD
MQGENVTRKLIDFIADTTFDDLPQDVIHDTKRFILQVIGNCFGGYVTEIGRIGLRVVRELGGKPESSIIGSAEKTSCANAAYVNAKNANALDFDDAHLNFLHIGPTLVPAAFAMGEKLATTGKDLLLAVALGYDTAARVGLSLGMPYTVEKDGSFTISPVYGTSWKVFGSAVAAGKILQLNKEQMTHAFAIAGANAPMPAMRKWEFDEVIPLPLQKVVDYGWISQAGVVAALLGLNGSTGYRTILEGENGFWRMSGARQCDFEFMVEDMGIKWHILDAGLKPYPACRHIHCALDLLKRIISTQNLRWEDIHRIEVGVSPMCTQPIWMNPTPKNMVESQFSIPHCLAMIAFGVRPGPDWHSPEMLTDARVAELRGRVNVVLDQEARQAMIDQYPSFYRRLPTKIKVVAQEGTFSEETEYAKGENWNPEFRMTDEELQENFRSNALKIWEGSTSWRQQMQAAMDVILDLEVVGCVTELSRLLSPLPR